METDMELVVEGKRVKTSSYMLAHNSSVFKTLISNARTSQQLDLENLEFTEKKKRLNLEIPNTKYNDMKLMITCLQPTGDFRDLTGDNALRVLPLAEQYQVKKLIKACKKALQTSMEALQKKHGRGNIPINEVMNILSAADGHNFDTVRSLCVDELSYKSDSSRRRQIVKEKHVSEKTKLKILEKMCNKLDDDYASNLKQIRNDMDERCREIQQQRDEFLEMLETWKSDLRQEVDDMIETNKETHKKFTDELHKQKIIEGLEASLKQTSEELIIEQQHINDRLQSLIENMEANEVIGDLEATKMREDWEEAHNQIVENIENISARFKSRTESILKVCPEQTEFASSFVLQSNVCKAIEDIEERLKQTEMTKIAFEEEKVSHDNTKSDLLKMKMKEHELNTWLKWAKPETTNDDKCMCFRHTKIRNA